MKINLYNRSLLSLVNHSSDEIKYLLDLAKNLKKDKYLKQEKQYLKQKNIALIFEKTSTRTRCAFEVAAYDQGANTTFIDPVSSQMNHKESIKDTARVLSRMFDAIEYRGSKQHIVNTLDKYSRVPVFNGLTEDFHPTQMLADLLTMQEHSNKPLNEIKFLYTGDCNNNISISLLLVAAKLGMDIRLAAPKYLWPSEDIINQYQEFANESGAKILITEDINKAVLGVDYIHTDIWVSMGDPINSWNERIDTLLPYQVNMKLLQSSNNKNVKFMHCLPAIHNTETQIGKEIITQYPHLKNGLEVTEEVFESKYNIAFDQAENRMHTIKAILVASLSEEM